MQIFAPDPTQQAQQQTQDSMWTGLSPQQKMAMMLMQGQHGQQTDQRGSYSPMQGMSQIANQLMLQKMMQPKPNPNAAWNAQNAADQSALSGIVPE